MIHQSFSSQPRKGFPALLMRWGALGLLGISATGLHGAQALSGRPRLNSTYPHPIDPLVQEPPERPASHNRPASLEATSPQKEAQEPQELDIPRFIELMRKNLFNYKAAEVHCEGGTKRLVLFGPTRSGKSTLTNYLLGTPFEAIAKTSQQDSDDDDSDGSPGPAEIIGFQVVSTPGEASSPGARNCAEVSAGIQSCTTHPAGYPQTFAGNPYLVVDTPGTEDNRGMTYKFCVAVGNRAFIGNEPVHAVGLVCKLSALTEDGARTFIDTFSLLFEIFDDPFAHIPSIFLFFSHPHDAPLKKYLEAYRSLIAMADEQEAASIVSGVTKIAPLMKALYNHWRKSEGKGPKYGKKREKVAGKAQAMKVAVQGKLSNKAPTVPCNFFSINPLEQGAQRERIFESLNEITEPIPASEFRFMGSARLKKQILALAEEKVLQAQRHTEILASHPAEVDRVERALTLSTQKLQTLQGEAGEAAVMTLKQAKKTRVKLRQQLAEKEEEQKSLHRRITEKEKESHGKAYKLDEQVHRTLKHEEARQRGWFSFLSSDYGDPASRAHTFAYHGAPFLTVRELPGEEAGGTFTVKEYLQEEGVYVAEYLPRRDALGAASVEIISYPRLVNRRAFEALQQELDELGQKRAVSEGDRIALEAELEGIEGVIRGERQQSLEEAIAREEERLYNAQAQREALEVSYEEAQGFWEAEHELLDVLHQIIPFLGANDRIALMRFNEQAYEKGLGLLRGQHNAGAYEEGKEED